MSVQAITCAMALRGVSPSEKLLLLALANYADEHMQAWPSQKRLADDTCLTDRTVRALLSALAARGLISRTARQREDNSRTTDVVTLQFPGVAATGISGGAENISGGVRKPVPGGAETASGREPSTNPQKEKAAPLAKPLPAEPVRSLAVWVSEIWEITPRPGRERSGRRDLENALKAAQRRGEDLAKVKLGLVGYFGSEDATKAAGQFCKGVHVVISSGRWEAFVGAGNTDPPEPDDPWRERMLRWSMNQYWNSEWGPKPGKPGCLAPKDLLDRAA